LIVLRMSSKKVFTFFLEGLMRRFPSGYRRTFCGAFQSNKWNPADFPDVGFWEVAGLWTGDEQTFHYFEGRVADDSARIVR